MKPPAWYELKIVGWRWSEADLRMVADVNIIVRKWHPGFWWEVLRDWWWQVRQHG